MERLQPEMERVGVRWREGPQDHADEDLEAGCAHVQQVTILPVTRSAPESLRKTPRRLGVLS